MMKTFRWLEKAFNDYLTFEVPQRQTPLVHYQTLKNAIKPADVLLVEGRSRLGRMIKVLSQSIWTHTALCIGEFHDIKDKGLPEHLQQFFQEDRSEPLIIESLLGEGTIIAPLSKYQSENIRLCRPIGLSFAD